MKKRALQKMLSAVVAVSMLCGSLGTTSLAKEEKIAGSTGIPNVQEVLAEVPGQATGTVYYVDSSASAGGDGTIGSPFHTLAEVNEKVLQPGDGISLKKGSVFENQQLVPQGRGTAGNPIVINTYGDGERPAIHAGGFRKTGGTNEDGTPEYAGYKEAVLIENMEYVYVSGLEVTNDDDFTTEWVTSQGAGNKDKDFPRRLGIHVTIDERARHNSYKTSADGEGYRSYKGVVINDCYIHNVDGNENRGVNKVDGGIGIEVIFSSAAGVYPYFDGVTIQKNRIDKCDRTGIKGIRISDLDNFRYNNPNAADYDPNCDADNNGANDSSRYNNIRTKDQVQRNYRVVGNYLSDIGGDGILICETVGAVVEHNVLDGQAMRAAGANAGIWSWNAYDTLFRYNESFHGPAYNQDGCSFDSDYWSAGTTFEYNYSHDTPMGFMLLMGQNDTDIVRYNVSQNDGLVWRHVAGNSNTPSYIYNNIFIYDGADWIYNYSGAAMSNRNNWQMYNNIFYNTSTTTPSKWGNTPENADWSKVLTATNMVYEASGQYGGAGEIPNAIYADPKFKNPGAGATAADGVTNWDSLKCYELESDSPAINAGTFVNAVAKTSSNNTGHWDYTSDRNATHDFFGNPLYNGTPDLGVSEAAAYAERNFETEGNATYELYDQQSASWLSSAEDGTLQSAAKGSEFILATAGNGYHVQIWNMEKNAYLYLNGSDTGVSLSETADTIWEVKDMHNGLHYLKTGEKALTLKNNAFSMEAEGDATQWQLCRVEGSKFYNAGGAAIDGFSADQVFDEAQKKSGHYGEVAAAAGLTGSDVFGTGLTGTEVGYKIYAKDGEHNLKLYLSGTGTTMDILVNGEIYKTGYTLSGEKEVLEIPSVYPSGGMIDIKLLAAYHQDTGELTKPVLNGISGEKMPMSDVKTTINCGNTAADGSANHDGLGGDVAFDGGSGYYSNNGSETEAINGALSGSKPVPDAGMGTALKCARAGTDFGYKFKVSPGEYRVKLYFNMPSTAVTAGKFNISINGETVRTGFDIQEVAGGTNKAIDITEVVTAQGGMIDIGFLASEGKAMINAIVLEPYKDVTGTNLATGKTVTASGSESSSMQPQYAVDANQSTRWASGATTAETWLSVDLEKDYMVDTVVIDWTPGAYATDYRVEVMAEDGEWQTAKRVSSAYPGINILSLEPIQARYVKVVGERYNSQWGMSLTEMSLFGEEVRGKAAATVATAKTEDTYTTAIGLENIYNTYRTLTFSVTYDPQKAEIVDGSESWLAEAALLSTKQETRDNEDGTKTRSYSFDFKKQGAFKTAADILSLKFQAKTAKRSAVYVDTTFTTADGHETKLGQLKTYVPNEFVYQELEELIAEAQKCLDEAVVGKKPGQYTAEVKGALQTETDTAKGVAPEASSAELERAYKSLEKAIEVFRASANKAKYHTYHRDFAVDKTIDYKYTNASGSAGEGTFDLALGLNGEALDNGAPKLAEGSFYLKFKTDSVEDQTLFIVGNGIMFGFDKGGGNWFYDKTSDGGWGNFTTDAAYALTPNEEHSLEFQFTLNDSGNYDLKLWYDGTKIGDKQNVKYDTSGGSYKIQSRRKAHNVQLKEVYYTGAPRHTLTVTAGEHGSTSEAGALTTYEEAYKTISFQPEEGYKVDQVTVDGSPVTITGNSYTFEYITENHTLNVTFKEIDKNVLQEAVTQAGELTEADYTKGSWKALTEAVTEAQGIIDASEIDTVKINSAYKALMAAVDQLVSVKELKAEIEAARKLEEAKYTRDSWKELADTIEQAELALESESTTEDDVTDAAASIRTAKEKLVSIDDTDKTALKAAIKKAEGLVENSTDYTAGSIKAVNDAIAEAKKVSEDARAGQKAIDEAEAEVNKAADGLISVKELKTEIEAVKELKEEEYTRESWKELADTIVQANLVLENESATEAGIADAAASIRTAVEKLVSVKDTDKTALAAAISKAEALLNSTDYTGGSAKALKDAVAEAKKVSADVRAGQKQVDAAAAEINKALGSLISVKDLRSTVAAMEKVVKGDYTDASYTAFQKALQQAKTILAKETATQAEIDGAKKSLTAAYTALAKKPIILNLSGASVSTSSSCTYNGKAQKPVVKVVLAGKTLKSGTDYTVSYKSNVNVGTATVTITAKSGGYTGSVTKKFTIKKAAKKIAVKKTAITKAYGDRPFSLGVSTNRGEKLAYSLSSKSVVKVSNGKATIVGCGKVTITIKSAASKNYNAAPTKKMTITVKPKKALITTVKSKRAGQMTVGVRRDTKATGYEISYATNSRFKSAKKTKVKSYRSTSAAISKLKKGKTYYVRVRSYKMVGKTVIYGDYSSAKKVVVRK